MKKTSQTHEERYLFNGLIDSRAVLDAMLEIQRTGTFDPTKYELSANARAYLMAERAVRNSVYDVKEDLRGADLWTQTLTLCMGQLFTSPKLALENLQELRRNEPGGEVGLRLKAWNMHLLLLIGYQKEGIAARSEVEADILDSDNLWKAELLTLLALSYYSTSQSRRAVELHKKALIYTDRVPEIFFRTFGASMAERAAVKAGDPVSFQYFSNVLDECLRNRPDARYALRQHGYRAMVLTQLGETANAERHWANGDRLLEVVDGGSPSVERVQFLMFRALASILMGKTEEAKFYCGRGKDELREMVSFDLHSAELDICSQLIKIGDPRWRSNHIDDAKTEITKSISNFRLMTESVSEESVRSRYLEAIGFLQGLLTGDISSTSDALFHRDRWETLTLTVLDQCQNAQSFATRLNYFRLIPTFVSSIESNGLSDEGIHRALESTLGFSLSADDSKNKPANEELSLDDSSEVSGVVRFAKKLKTLARQADDSVRSEAIVETTQMVVHDIKRPFRLFSSALKIFESKLPKAFFKDPTLLAALSCLRESERKVNGLLSDLLVADRRLELSKEEVDIRTLIKDCVRELGADEDVNIRLRMDLAGVEKVYVDRLKFERAILNVLENAKEHTIPGGEVTVWSRTLEGGCLRVEIKNPSFIEPNAVPLLFERFYTKGKSTGTGLGLFITRKIVAAHGGEISCASTRESGTTFRIDIPQDERNQNCSSYARNCHAATLKSGRSSFGLLFNA